MRRAACEESTNPYHYVLHCIGGKWKMTILHEIHTFGKIRFNQTLRVLPISEKMLSQQLKELVDDGLIQRIVDGSTYPPQIDYVLTNAGEQLIPAMDMLYVWSVRQMHEKDIPLDKDALSVHKDDRYTEQLKDVIEERHFQECLMRDPMHRKK